MAYRIVSSDSHKIVLEREPVGVAAGAFIIIGSIFFVIGIGLNYLMSTWEMPFLIFRMLFPFFGLIAIAVGIRLPKQTRETQPEQITFDHDNGAVIVDMTKVGDQRGHIRYDEIEDFDIHVESRRSSSSSSRSSTYYHYHVFIKKKDGGAWHIFQYGNRGDAEVVVAQLKSQVPLNRPFNTKGSIQTKLTNKIEKKDGLDKTIIHWQNKISAAAPIFLAVFSLVFISIVSSFFSFGTQLDVFFLIVIGFILTVFGLVLFSVVRKLIKDATTRYAVSIDHQNLEYYEFSKSTGAMRNKKTIPLSEVLSINYTFAPLQAQQDAGLRILTKKDEVRSQEVKEKPLEAIKDLFAAESPITLSITALNPIECLQLENWLQELILKKGNVVVK